MSRSILGGLTPVLVAAALTAPATLAEGPAEDRPRGGGRLAAVVGGDLDLVGDIWVDLPAPWRPSRGVYLGLVTRTSIERATSNLTFLVRDLQYDLQLGWRGRGGDRGPRPFVAGGQRGREAVDHDGQGWVRYVGAGVQSRGYHLAGAGAPALRWSALLAPTLGEREVRAGGVARLDLRWQFGPRIFGGRFAVDFAVDGLIDGGALLADVTTGPSLGFPVAGGLEARFFAHYQSSRHPLGLEEDVWLAGFTYYEGAGAPLDRGRPPEIDGRLAAGGGDGRWVAELEARFLSPSFGPDLRAAFLFDGNILTADDTGDLYYRYHIGLEAAVSTVVVGGWFYHRSNHQLAEANAVVTSINVAEVGVETPGWRLPVGALPSAKRLRLDGWARAGALIDSSFGEDRRWHARGGARLALIPSESTRRPYALVDLEFGDVESGLYALGGSVSRDVELQIEYRSDDQLFSADRHATLFTVRYGF